MSKFTIKVEGLKECEQALADLLNIAGTSRATGINTVKRALIYAAEPIEKAARVNAPVRKGRLKISITTGTKLSKRQKAQHVKRDPVEVFVGAGPLPQAHLQEFGTHNQPPQRFLTPAVEQNLDAVISRFTSRLKEEIDKAADRARAKQARLISSARS